MTETRTPILRVVLLFVAGLCAAGQFAKISILFPELRLIYPEAGAELGFLVSLLSLIGIALGLVAGLVVASVGFKRMLVASLFVGALISAYQASLPPLPLMLLSRAIEGLTQVGIVVAAPTLITLISARRHHPLVMALWSTIFGVTFALFATLGLPFATAFGPPALFLAHAAVLTLVGLALIFALPRETRPEVPSARLTPSTIIRRHAEVYASPFMLAPAAGFVFYTLTFVSLMTLLPDYIDPDWRVFTIAAMPLASIAASLTSGATLLRRFSAVSVAISGFAIGASMALALIALPGNPALCIILFMALGLVQGASFAAIPELNAGAEEQALANGALAQTGNIGNTLGTPVLLALGSAGGFPALIGLVALAHASGALVHWSLRRKRNAAPDASAG